MENSPVLCKVSLIFRNDPFCSCGHQEKKNATETAKNNRKQLGTVSFFLSLSFVLLPSPSLEPSCLLYSIFFLHLSFFSFILTLKECVKRLSLG